jgi:hypothetical protein
MEGFLKEEATRLALLVSDPALNPDARESVMRDINGLGAFNRYLSMLIQIGFQAERAIEENEETLEDLRQESAHMIADEDGGE